MGIWYEGKSLFTRFMVIPIFSVPRLVNMATTIPNKDAVYIGRPSRWGNPYRLSKYSRSEAIRLFEIHLVNSGLIEQIHILKNKQLVCFCHPKACHGEVLLKYITPLESEK